MIELRTGFMLLDTTLAGTGGFRSGLDHLILPVNPWRLSATYTAQVTCSFC